MYIECKVCGEQYKGSTVTKFQSRVNNYKSTHRNFWKKNVFPNQALKQKQFHEYFIEENHVGLVNVFQL